MEQAFNFLIGCWTISNIIGIIAGFVIGYSISIGTTLNKGCSHNWILIQDGELFKFNDNLDKKVKVGFMKVYECTRCKKMRKETITI